MALNGYAGEILRIDLSTGKKNLLPTGDYVHRFLGGRGLAVKLYWDLVPAETKSFDPDNTLICATGPVTGFAGFAGCRWQICGKTALNGETFSYGNLGDKWGAYLKHNGYDALVLQGSASRPVYILISEDGVDVRDADHLWGQSAMASIAGLKHELGPHISVLTIGPAAENRIPFSTLYCESGASASGGLGSILGSKLVKAVVVAKSANRPTAADPDALHGLAADIGARRKEKQKRMSAMVSPWQEPGITSNSMCYGCGLGCSRQSYTGPDGRRYKSFCQQTDVYRDAANAFYPEDSTQARLSAMRLCDGYGLDTAVMQPMISWLAACYRAGVLSEAQTGLPLSTIGSMDFIEKLVGMIARREGFGEELAQGTLAAADRLGCDAMNLTADIVGTTAGETREYDPRVMVTNALIYATEPRRPIQQLHEIVMIFVLWSAYRGASGPATRSLAEYQRTVEHYWGSAAAADMSTIAGKGLAAKKIQDRSYAKESLVLCDLVYPMGWISDYKSDPQVAAFESRIVSAITGRAFDETELHHMGEKIFNLQRAVLVRQGWRGRYADRILDYYHDRPIVRPVMFTNENQAPGPNGEACSRMNAVVDRDDFARMKDDYYAIRGWNPQNGLQTETTLKALDLGDVAEDLKARGLLG